MRQVENPFHELKVIGLALGRLLGGICLLEWWRRGEGLRLGEEERRERVKMGILTKIEFEDAHHHLVSDEFSSKMTFLVGPRPEERGHKFRNS